MESARCPNVLGARRGKLLRRIEDAPTVDAVPVVRCKDCKHYALWEDGRAMFHCDKRDCTMYDDDFCSYGERENDAHA